MPHRSPLAHTPPQQLFPEDTMPDTQGVNFFEIDDDLQLTLKALLPADEFALALPHFRELGALVGDALDSHSRAADANPPVLRTYDHRGAILNAVDYHPAYTAMEQIAIEHFGLVAMSHRPVMDFGAPLRHTLKYAFWYLFGQAEFALACPMSMTDSAVRVLSKYGSSELKERYASAMIRTDGAHFSGAQFMTEKQGGSDVGSNIVRAEQRGAEWLLWGDKWFCSNVSADVALVLARPDGAVAGTAGLAMFLMPRVLPDGSMNDFRVNRLKDKLGTRAMASGEVTFAGAHAYLVGDLGTGFKQMMSMVNSSRLSNAMRSSALMRRSYVEALTSTTGREAFGGPLVEKPLMRKALFRMLLDTEAASATLFHTATVYDRADAAVTHLTPEERAASVPPDPDSRHVRLLTPILKGVICKRARHIVAEGMEARGGNGYIDEWVDGKLLREAQLGSIWEGTTNIVALDVQRALLRNDSGTPFFADIADRLALSVNDPQLGGLAEVLLAFHAAAEQSSKQLSSAAVDRREVAAARQMNDLYDVLAASLFLEQARSQLQASGNARKIAVLIGYMEEHMLGEARSGSAAESLLLGGYATEILTNGHVPFGAVETALSDTVGRATAARSRSIESPVGVR
ncbi:hypothetical protein ACI1US_01749 [Leucobacter sp. BZR 635]